MPAAAISGCLLQPPNSNPLPAAAAQDEALKVEALLARRAALAQKKADLVRRVKELGSLPADAFERYRGQPLPALHALLAKAHSQLKKYQCAPVPSHSRCWYCAVAYVVPISNSCLRCRPCP